jgi:O-succinylbenzoic acid--CoA ligase
MTHALMVPAMYNLCLLQPDFAQHDLARWRIGAYGGAPMPLATIEVLARTVPALTLMNVYGATETTSPVTMVPAGCTAQRIATVGTTLACAEVRIVDDAGQDVARDALGEIWIKGPMTVPGYWDNPQATVENISAGWWHSGDIGALDADGYLRVVDRKKDMINRGGFKIYTIEVENALYAHPAVQECAVVARPCPVLGERVHAFVYLRDAVVTAEALAAHCRPLLSDYKVPDSYTLSTTPLPRNANGKLVKRALRETLAPYTR